MSIEWYLSEEATGKKIHREENLVFCKEQLLDKKTEIFDPTMSMANKDSAAVNVYSDLKCQEILGFGGAMTEAAALNLQRLSEANMNRILDSYFGLEEGNRYRFCRVPIGSSDFSDAPYDYVREDDLRLSSFSLKHDEETIFPEIRRAAGFAKQGLEVIATPWSPPCMDEG